MSAQPPGDPSPDDPLAERVVGSRLVHDGHYLQLRIDELERSDGSRASREIVGHPGAVAVVALDADDRVVLVRQWRAAADRALLEIPAGTLDRDPTTGALEDPDGAAARELAEEVGLRAGTWQKLAEFWTAPGFATELMHLYLATDLEPAGDEHAPEEDERLEVVRLPRAEAIGAAERGEIGDAKTLIGLLWLARLGEAAVTAVTAAAVATAAAEPEPGSRGLVDAAYSMSVGDMIRATIALTRLSRGMRVLGAAFVAAGAFLIGLSGDLMAGLLPLIFGLLLVTGFYCVPFVWYQVRKRPELITQLQRIRADEVGFQVAGSFGTGAYPWTAFTRVRERGGLIFLDLGVGANMLIPTRHLGEEQLGRLRRLFLDAGFSPDGHPVDRASRPGG